jgi:NADH-quinone oxidoreductase subunit E
VWGSNSSQEEGNVIEFEPKELVEIIERNGGNGVNGGNGADGSLISMLEEIQAQYRYLPRDAMILVSEGLGVPLSQIYSVATFYHSFSLVPRGKHTICVCTGTACHVRGAVQVLERLETRLGIAPGGTTHDREFTLETVNCLGCCALGPVVVVDDEYEGQMTTRKVDKLLQRAMRQVGGEQ